MGRDCRYLRPGANHLASHGGDRREAVVSSQHLRPRRSQRTLFGIPLLIEPSCGARCTVEQSDGTVGASRPRGVLRTVATCVHGVEQPLVLVCWSDDKYLHAVHSNSFSGFTGSLAQAPAAGLHSVNLDRGRVCAGSTETVANALLERCSKCGSVWVGSHLSSGNHAIAIGVGQHNLVVVRVSHVDVNSRLNGAGASVHARDLNQRAIRQPHLLADGLAELLSEGACFRVCAHETE